jgi:cysteine desulfurase
VIYLDANASEPPLASAKEAARAALDVVGNPSSPHALGRKARALLDDARDAIAAMLGAQAKEVVLTSGASEGNRFVVDALAATLPKDAIVLTSDLEHPSLARPLARAPFHVVRMPLGGLPDGSPPRAVCVTAAHNETGILTDLERLCAWVPDDAIVCVDAAQTAGRLPPLPQRVDVIVCSAHKLGGLAGSGALVLRGRARAFSAPWAGGGQEGGLRPGTEALVLHAAFGAAAREIEATRARSAALAPKRDRLERALVQAWGAVVIGAGRARLPQTTALMVPDVPGEPLRIAIDLKGVCVGFGSACSALAPEPSPALMSLGLTAEQARATVRLSLPLDVTDADVDEAIARLAPLVPHLRS